jgi:hypothetical protein
MMHPGNKESSSPDIQFNEKEKRYEIIEVGILYAFPVSLLGNLKQYYNKHKSVEQWFAQLAAPEKQQVLRLGLPDIDNYNSSNLSELL